MILSFAKPDESPPGVRAPSASREHRLRWKASLLGAGTGDHQIKIRSEKPRSNLLAIVSGAMPGANPVFVRSDQPYDVRISANGSLVFSPEVWAEFTRAIHEAKQVLVLLDDPTTQDRALKAIREGRHPLKSL